MTAMKKYATKALWWSLTLLITLLVATAGFFVGKRAVLQFKKQQANVAAPTPSFDARDTVQFAPVANKVTETTSDMTVHSILSGGFGAAVVMIYADWCVHCRNMMPAFEAAAAKSSVPFVRIQGQTAPVTSQKHKILGYPTVLGITDGGVVHRFAEARTEEALVAFASSLKAAPVVAEIPPEVITIAT